VTELLRHLGSQPVSVDMLLLVSAVGAVVVFHRGQVRAAVAMSLCAVMGVQVLGVGVTGRRGCIAWSTGCGLAVHSPMMAAAQQRDSHRQIFWEFCWSWARREVEGLFLSLQAAMQRWKTRFWSSIGGGVVGWTGADEGN